MNKNIEKKFDKICEERKVPYLAYVPLYQLIEKAVARKKCEKCKKKK